MIKLIFPYDTTMLNLTKIPNSLTKIREKKPHKKQHAHALQIQATLPCYPKYTSNDRLTFLYVYKEICIHSF